MDLHASHTQPVRQTAAPGSGEIPNMRRRGRGSVSNHTGRFESLTRIDEAPLTGRKITGTLYLMRRESATAQRMQELTG
jgi:hypothetical protein